MTDEILEFRLPNRDGICYVEGNADKVFREEGGSTWFAFEETFAESVRLLKELGFTSEQILAAVGS
jgi:hypothetical protein